MKKLLYLSVLLGIIYSCETIEFTEPFPQKGMVITEFPSKYYGTYFSNYESSYAHVYANKIVIHKFNVTKKTFRKETYKSEDFIIIYYKGNLYINYLKDEKWICFRPKFSTNYKKETTLNLLCLHTSHENTIENVEKITPIKSKIVQGGWLGAETKYSISPKNLDTDSIIEEFSTVLSSIKISDRIIEIDQLNNHVK